MDSGPELRRGSDDLGGYVDINTRNHQQQPNSYIALPGLRQKKISCRAVRARRVRCRPARAGRPVGTDSPAKPRDEWSHSFDDVAGLGQRGLPCAAVPIDEQLTGDRGVVGDDALLTRLQVGVGIVGVHQDDSIVWHPFIHC